MSKAHRFNLPELIVAPAVSPVPLLMQYNNVPVDFGVGVNAITGEVVSSSLVSIPAPPSTLPGTQTSFSSDFTFISTSSQFASAVQLDASVSTYSQIVNGTFSASYFDALDVSSLDVVVIGTGTSTNGAYSSSTTGAANSWNPTTVDASTVVSTIGSDSYEDFIAVYGTHFIGGVIYGNQDTVTLDAQYQNIGSQTAAAAAVAGQIGSDTSGGQFSASISTLMSSQSGFVSQSWSQQVMGGFQPLAANSVTNINSNLESFAGATATPIFYLLYDWRILPAVNTAAGTLTFDFSDYVSNLPDVQTAVSQLSYIVNTCTLMINNSIYNGAMNLQTIQQIQQDAQAGLNILSEYAPANVAAFNYTTFMSSVSSVLAQLTNISNGMYNVQVSATLDGSFNPQVLGPTVFSVFGGNGTRYGWTMGKSNGEDWFFGFYVPDPPGIIEATPIQGLILNGGVISPTWSNGGTGIYYNNNSTSSSETISGVNNGTYPWLTTTVQLV